MLFSRHCKFLFLAFFLVLVSPTALLAKSLDVHVEIGEETGVLSPLLFGSNLSWTDNGGGLLDLLAPSMTPAASTTLDKLRAVKPSIIRFPGGELSSHYNWKEGVGPRENRKQGTTFLKHLQPMSFGTDEYLKILALFGAEGMITVSPKDSPEQSADWLRYVKEHSGTAQPVKWWEVGNETYLPPDPSHMTAEEYVRHFVLIREALKKVDPEVQVGALLEANLLGVKWAKFVVPESDTWNRIVLDGTKGLADFYIIHLYGPFDSQKSEMDTRQTILATPDALGRNMEAIRRRVAAVAGHKPIFVTEFNVGLSDAKDRDKYLTSPIQAPYIADMLIAFVENNMAGACFWGLIGDYVFGMVESVARPVYRPAGHVYEALAPLQGARVHASKLSGPVVRQPLRFKEAGVSGKPGKALAAHVLTMKTAEGYVVLAVNRSVTDDLDLTCGLGGQTLRPVSVERLGPGAGPSLTGTGVTLPPVGAYLIHYAEGQAAPARDVVETEQNKSVAQ